MEQHTDITIKRIAYRTNYTIGKLYVNGNYVCDTLEDKDRGLDDTLSEDYINKIKVFGKTAIPAGKYNVSITYSPHFKKNLPLVTNVKGFDGIRIHSGNTDKDTLGCILVGYNNVTGKVINSKEALAKLMSKLSGKITLEIVRN
jgi:predicted porin